MGPVPLLTHVVVQPLVLLAVLVNVGGTLMEPVTVPSAPARLTLIRTLSSIRKISPVPGAVVPLNSRSRRYLLPIINAFAVRMPLLNCCPSTINGMLTSTDISSGFVGGSLAGAVYFALE